MNTALELYTVEQIRSIEHQAFQSVDEALLMRRAGASAFKLMQKLYPELRHITVLCGMGNNGGDGLVLARLAFDAGLEVRVLTLGELSKQSELAGLMLQEVIAVDIELKPFGQAEKLFDTDLIIDAMLGIGITGDVRSPFIDVIEQVNMGDVPVFALDIPSGINADTGCPQPEAIKATQTVTFIGYKQGMVTGKGKNFCGELYLESLELTDILESHPFSGLRAEPSILNNILPPLVDHVHKGMMGHIAIIGGDQGMPGAVCLAAEAAMRVGAGKVTVVTRERHFPIVMNTRAEFLCLTVEEDLQPLQALLKKVDVCVVGPGMSQTDWSSKVFNEILNFKGVKIVDAGALIFLKAQTEPLDNLIITPHPGEAATLLSSNVEEIEANRYQAAQTLADTYAEVAILKGAGTIIQTQQGVNYVSTAGNPGMATAGMGDVLAGMIGGLAAQCSTLEDTALAGVILHAHSSDIAASNLGQRSLLAGDVVNFLGEALSKERIEWIIEESL